MSIKNHTGHKLVKISDLKLHPKNRNTHPEHQIRRLAEILEYQGWRYPVKVSNQSGYVTAGHGRIEAAKLKGWTEVPVNYQDYDNEDQEYADLVADNAIASWAELDLSGVNADLADFDPSFDINLLGIENFSLDLPFDDKNKNPLDIVKKYSIAVEFPNEMEMMDIHDDLLSRGYVVRIL